MEEGTIDASTRCTGARTSRTLPNAVLIAVIAMIGVLPPTWAVANHADGCPESEPGPSNGTAVVVGTSGDDRCLVGANGADVVRGRGGDDRVIGNHGPDRLIGGPGDDRLWGGRGPDTFLCGPGFDRVYNRRSTGADFVDPSCEIVR
jgi:hypothetical protein